jgi:hypothetical protein
MKKQETDMKKKVELRLTEGEALWLRNEAARNKTSVSRFVGDFLKGLMRLENEYDEAMQRALVRKPFGPR